jgi:hypothetical protein
MGETIKPDQDSFTLISSDSQERVINPANTHVLRFEGDPYLDCIEITYFDTAESMARELLFIPDRRILNVAEGLGFKAVRFAETPDEYVDAYTSPRNHSIELDWDIRDATARSLIDSDYDEFNVVEQDYPELLPSFKSPIVKFITRDGVWLEMTYINTAIFKIDTRPEMDHVYVHRVIDGEASEHYVFDVDMLIEELEEKNFPMMRSPYPGQSDIEEFMKWQRSRIGDDWSDFFESDQNGPEQGIGGDTVA